MNAESQNKNNPGGKSPKNKESKEQGKRRPLSPEELAAWQRVKSLLGSMQSMPMAPDHPDFNVKTSVGQQEDDETEK